MNIDGVVANFGLTITTLPTLFQALTNRAWGAWACSLPIRDSWVAVKVAERAVLRRRVGDRVGRVDHQLAGKVGDAGLLDRRLGAGALDREHDRVGPRGRLGEAADRRVGRSPRPSTRRALRLARAAHHRVAVVQEAVAEDLTDLAGSENADLRHGGTLSRRSPSSDPECAPPGPDDR